LIMRRILLVVAALVLMAGCGDESSNGKGSSGGGASDSAATRQANVSVPTPAASVPPAGAADPVVAETPTLRTAIIGTWEESVFGGGRGAEMSFGKDGRYEGFAVSTKYTGTYRVVDEHTIELNIASVMSEMRLVKKTLTVDWRDDLLTITSETPKRTYEKQK
jgi:hypothetical protein